MTGRHEAPASPLSLLDDLEHDQARLTALALHDEWYTWATGSAPYQPWDWATWAGRAAVILKELAR